MRMSDLRRLDQISLSHGQAIWVTEAMQIAAWLDTAGLNAVVKKLRRHWVPFSEEELQKPRWEAVRYGFEHLLEVVVALKMTADGMAFRHIASLLTSHRKKLRSIYRRAFLEADGGLGAPVEIRSADGRSMAISGLYLDFSATARINGMLASLAPTALAPWEALQRYMGIYVGLHMFPLIRISQLATEAVRLAEAAPEVKRGPKG
jgi:hypothetical protein